MYLTFATHTIADMVGSVLRFGHAYFDISFKRIWSALSSADGFHILQRSYLSRWCTTDVRTSVKEMLPALFSPELARALSLKGHNQKKPLGNTHIFDIVAGKKKLMGDNWIAALVNVSSSTFCA